MAACPRTPRRRIPEVDRPLQLGEAADPILLARWEVPGAVTSAGC